MNNNVAERAPLGITTRASMANSDMRSAYREIAAKKTTKSPRPGAKTRNAETGWSENDEQGDFAEQTRTTRMSWKIDLLPVC